nr:hypothetical protein [Conexibacter sp. W3-3-2]
MLARDLDGAVGGAGVDDDDLVDGVAHRGQAAAEHRLLVLDDHAQRERQALGGTGARGDAAGALVERAQRGGDGGRQAGHAGEPGGLAAGDLAQVAGGVRQLGVEPQRGLEQAGGGAQRPELVERDARPVEQQRLARVVLEQLERRVGDGGEHGRDDGDRRAVDAQSGLQERGARLPAAVRVLDVRGLAEQAPVGGDVAAREQRLRARDEQRGGCRARLRNGRQRDTGPLGRIGRGREAEGHAQGGRTADGAFEFVDVLPRSGDGDIRHTDDANTKKRGYRS